MAAGADEKPANGSVPPPEPTLLPGVGLPVLSRRVLVAAAAAGVPPPAAAPVAGEVENKSSPLGDEEFVRALHRQPNMSRRRYTLTRARRSTHAHPTHLLRRVLVADRGGASAGMAAGELGGASTLNVAPGPPTDASALGCRAAAAGAAAGAAAAGAAAGAGAGAAGAEKKSASASAVACASLPVAAGAGAGAAAALRAGAGAGAATESYDGGGAAGAAAGFALRGPCFFM